MTSKKIGVSHTISQVFFCRSSYIVISLVLFAQGCSTLSSKSGVSCMVVRSLCLSNCRDDDLRCERDCRRDFGCSKEPNVLSFSNKDRVGLRTASSCEDW